MNDKEIFVVGCGPSLKDFDFSLLKNKTTIAVNMVALDVPEPTFSITADSSILKKIQDGFFKDVKTTWVLITNPNHCTMKWIGGKFVNAHTGFVYNLFCVNMIIRNAGVEGIGFTFNDFKTGYNSGFCAFQLAVLLGYERIYLLGIDLTKQDNSYHYGNRYSGKTIGKNEFEKFYDNFVLALEIIQDQTDIQVISCSAISRLNKIIPYKPFSEIVNG